MFCTMWPNSPPKTSSLIAWIIERASDSTITWEIPYSKASNTPSCNAKASVTSEENVDGRTFLEAAIRQSRQFRIAIPVQEGLPYEAAPSVLILIKLEGGACQVVREGVEERAGRVQASLYSCKILFAISKTWLGVEPESSCIAWLRFHQMDQATAKNSSKSWGEPFKINSKATSTKSLGEEVTSTGQLCHFA